MSRTRQIKIVDYLRELVETNKNIEKLLQKCLETMELKKERDEEAKIAEYIRTVTQTVGEIAKRQEQGQCKHQFRYMTDAVRLKCDFCGKITQNP